MTTLKNVSLRMVGVYLRVNDPYNTAVVPPAGPTQIDLPEVQVGAAEPKVVDVMNGVAGLLMQQGFHFEFADDGPAGHGILNRVKFAHMVGDMFDYELDAAKLMAQTPITFAWQYYIFKKNLKDETKDERIPVEHRASYRSSTSPTIQDNYRIIWRLVPIDKNPAVGEKVQYLGA